MSAPTVVRDLVVAHTRMLKLPGVARTFESWLGKRATATGRTRTICTRSSAPSRRRATNRSSVSACARPVFQR